MATWNGMTAVALAGLMLAGAAFAQATAEGLKADKKSGMREGRKSGLAMGDEQVKAAQQALKDKGHDPGTVDGRMGPKTQAALRDFQKAQGMETTGRLDTKTMQSLGMDG